MTLAAESLLSKTLTVDFTLEPVELSSKLLELTCRAIEPGTNAGEVIHWGHWHFAGMCLSSKGPSAQNMPRVIYSRVEDAVTAALNGDANAFFVQNPFHTGIGVVWLVSYDPRPR